jgi:hypothetical protein
VSHTAPRSEPGAGEIEVKGMGRGAATGGPGGPVVSLSLILLILIALALCGCESNQERSARLGALRHRELLAHPLSSQRGLRVTHQSPLVKILSAVALHDENGIAAVVTLRNISREPLHNAPIAITVTGAGGATLYQNSAAGLEPTLVSVPPLAPGAQTVWVDDQVQAAGQPTGVRALVGEPSTPAAAGGPTPQLSVQGVHFFEDPSNGLGAAGVVLNHSAVAQQKLVIFAVGRRAGRIVAAGRAVLPEVPAGASAPFQVFFIGNPHGAKLEVSAPASTLG